MISAAALNAALRDYFADIIRPNSDLSKQEPYFSDAQEATPISDIPPVVVQSFAERINDLAQAMAPLKHPPEPEVMTVIDCYDCAGDDTYLGKLYLDASSGREYKFVTFEGKTVFL